MISTFRCKTGFNINLFTGAGAQRYSKIIAVLVVLLTFFAAPAAQAQLQRFPLKREADPTKKQPVRSVGKSAVGRTQAEADTLTLPLPFWDDFSFTSIVSNDTLLPSPLGALWEKHEQVWVNNGMGINPPSVNVATFDGLNQKGATYTDQILYNGFRDTLTSRPIRLNHVPAAERTSVYLSFAYQWQGNGEAPDNNDYMVVDFLRADSTWAEAMRIPFRSTLNRTEFRDTIVQVADASFFHKAFKFRFRNYGRQSGPYDTWNIDYVYLNKGRNAVDLFFPDRAITTQAGSFFEKYRTVPINHFAQVQNTVSAPFQVYNAQSNPVSVNYRANATIVNYVDSVPESHPQNLGDSIPLGYTGDNPPKGISVLGSREHLNVSTLPKPDFTQLNFGADSARIDIEIILNSKDNVYKDLRPPLDPDSTGDYIKKYLPIDFRNNDTIRTQYNLAKYYAYDDGTAEYSAGLTQAGNRGAYLFEMIIPTDTLVGFDIYFPSFGIVGTVTTDFYVYADDNGVPGVVLYTLASRQVLNRGLNIFQRFAIGEPFVVTDKFYIGWKAPVGSVLTIGLDYNNDSGDKMFFNTTGTWEQNTDVTGSLMIRPVFGNNGTTNGVEDPTRNVAVYPNPNTGSFYVTGGVDRVELMNITGQPVSFHTDSTDDGLLLSTEHAAPGLYILKIYKNNISSTRKLIIR